MNLQELRQKHAALCDKQEAIVDKALEEGRAMTEEENTEFNNLQTEIDGLAGLIAKAEAVQARAAELDQPANQILRPAQIPGDYSQNNRKLDDGGFSSPGEFLDALRFGDPKGRLNSLPRGQGQGGGLKMPDAIAAQIMPWKFKNEWRMDEGSKGGFAVGEQFDPSLLWIQPGAAIVRPRATVIPAGDPPDSKLTMPALKQGANGVLGGVTVIHVEEGGLKGETEGGLRQVTLEPHEVAGYTVVTDKLLRNWAAAGATIDTLLTQAVVQVEDIDFLRGNGVGKPIGVLNGSGTVAVHRAVANKIQTVDVLGMYAALHPDSVPFAVWVANQSTMPQITTLKDEVGNNIFLRGDVTRGIANTLLGIPIIFTGRVPALGSKGDLMLVDLRYYLIKDGSGPFVAASEHVEFKNNMTVIKIFWNYDGKGWVDEPLTLEDGATQVSPYVVLDVPAA